MANSNPTNLNSENEPTARRDHKETERLYAFAFGVLFVTTMLIVAIYFPEPTQFQYLIFRIVIALAAAGVAAMIPGFLQIEISGLIRAGGALAVFVIIYFYNPAILKQFGVQPPPPDPPDKFLNLAVKLSIAENAVKQIEKTLEEEPSPDTREKILHEIIVYYNNLIVHIDALKSEDPRAYSLLKDARIQYVRISRQYRELNLCNSFPEMVPIPSATYFMGINKATALKLVNEYHAWKIEWFDNEIPSRPVSLDSFYIGKYEITNAQYECFLENNPDHNKPTYLNSNSLNGPNQPVVGVSWYDAIAYCTWLSAKTKKNYRLPTEAEWERAAKGGEDRIFPWGNAPPSLNICTFMGQGTSTTRVGIRPAGASPFGVMDLAGNVKEWCRDWYSEDSYQSTGTRNPGGPISGTERVVRGGGWRDGIFDLRTTVRYKFPPEVKRDDLGFRVVREE